MRTTSQTSHSTRRRRSTGIAATLAAGLVALLVVGGPVLVDAQNQTATDDGSNLPPARTIVTTDPELDDLNSLLRMLLYSNEIDIDGLVYSASQHHYRGNSAAGIGPHRWPAAGDRLHIDEALDRYEAVYANLVVHDRNYPSPQALRNVVRWGNVDNVGDMAAPTPGSDLIRDAILDDEPGTLFLQAWGGPNTIARALRSVQEQYEGTPQWSEIQQKVYDKVVLTSFGQQDATFREYIRPNWPRLEHREVATSIWGYGARGSALPEWQVYFGPEWTREHVSSVGPIGAGYRVWGDGKQMAAGFDDEDYFGLSRRSAEELREMGYRVWTPPQPTGAWISEGDSSNFALLVRNGLRNHHDPTWGGWGGRQAVNPEDAFQWRNRGADDIGPDGQPRRDYSAGRWCEDFQLDFAARLQWSVTPRYEDANHAPDVTVPSGLSQQVRAGDSITLTGRASDPDGDQLTTSWWQYREAGTYSGAVVISTPTSLTTEVRVPADAQAGNTIHLILEVADDGAPAMTRYQRVVLTVVD